MDINPLSGICFANTFSHWVDFLHLAAGFLCCAEASSCGILLLGFCVRCFRVESKKIFPETSVKELTTYVFLKTEVEYGIEIKKNLLTFSVRNLSA